MKTCGYWMPNQFITFIVPYFKKHIRESAVLHITKVSVFQSMQSGHPQDWWFKKCSLLIEAVK
jgi:hypothetical protein